MESKNEEEVQKIIQTKTIDIEEKNYPLIYAIKTKNIKNVCLLLECQTGVNLDKDGVLPLHYAIIGRNRKIIQLLLKHGADVNCITKSGHNTPLYLAVRTGNLKIIKLLLANGANANAANYFGDTPLNYACEMETDFNKRKHWKMIKKIIHCLVKHGADINCNKKYLKRTPLHLAVYSSNIKLSRILLKYGADVNIVDTNGYTPLSLSMENENEELIRVLLKYITHLSIEYSRSLYLIIMKSNIKILNMVLEKTSNVDSLIWDGKTPLMSAIMTSNMEIIKILIKSGADVNQKVTDIDGTEMTPLVQAILQNSTDIVCLLLEHDADVNIECNGKRPLDISIEIESSIDIFKLILQSLPNLEAVNHRGTALYLAVGNGRESFLKILLDIGADINIREFADSVSLLQFAISKGNGLTIDMLLMHVMKLKTANKYITSEILECFNNELAARGTSYEREYNKLKSKIIHRNSYVTLYDVCTKNRREMSLYLRNTDLKNTLEIEFYNDYLKCFPYYSILLNCRIREAIRAAEMFEECHSLLRSILNDAFIFPEEITRLITRFLTNEGTKFIL